MLFRSLKAAAQVPDLLFDLVVDDQDFSADWLRRGEVVRSEERRVGKECER